ncbi:hypothetical protein QQS21_010968 [Conoideocrella luteorostrata]|uniref:PhoD-like phosphatase domain-containing protein n=1 Tax=Conoideocrella luteorostrata TaxID=1105319 RepID=A0AAJ0FU65_9HYPO|nr:hypothetical protein QQS21_010968 [Conoideocrella luteorostrata]
MAARQQQWGHLPDLQGLRDEYDDYTYPMPDDYGRSVPVGAQPPLRSRSNRASVQTSITEALTESTFSPHSPTASTFAGAAQGLAPRPPSYQRPLLFASSSAHGIGGTGGTGGVVASAASNPTRFDASTNFQEPVLGTSEEIYRGQEHPSAEQYQNSSFEPARSAPPAAPAAPRGPPLGYRQPHGSSPLPYSNSNKSSPHCTSTPPRQRQALPSGRVTADDEMEPEGHYTTRREDYSDVPRGHQIHDVTGRREGTFAPHTMGEYAAAGPPRRESLNGPSERRKKFANDRSPLQRLELTLDSMTKEEKRARVQAAEQRARERAARRAAEASANTPGDIENRHVPAEHQTYRTPSIAPAPKTEPHPVEIEHRGQVYSQRQPQHQMQTQAHSRPEVVVNRGYATASPPAILHPGNGEEEPPKSGLPKRNLSFRERAARHEQDIEPKDVSPVNQPTAFFTGGTTSGVSPPRNGSNKLQKDLAPDQWNPQRAQSTRVRGNAGIPKPLATTQAYAAVKDKELPPVPAVQDKTRGIQRRATEPVYGREYESDEEYVPYMPHGKAHSPGAHSPDTESRDIAAARRRLERQDSDHSAESVPEHRFSNMVFKDPENLLPGEGLYKPPVWLDEFEKATVGSLGGTLLDLSDSQPLGVADKNTAWWESGSRNKSSTYPSRPRKAEAFDGEYDDTNAPTRFKPPLYIKCGPLLRYCGIRQERIPARTQTNNTAVDRDIWRGSVMIVTQDSESSYDIAPMLRLFVQDIGLLPSPPHHVNGDLPAEYVDPIAGHPKLGRRGETLYVRPVEHLKEAKDHSLDETDEGLFERSRSPPDAPRPDGSELPQSFAGRQKRIRNDGEKLQKYKDVRGFRLHAERSCTFWRFNVEIELREKQQRIAYRINRGPCMAFWVPARAQTMNMMFHSCNGFSASVNPDDLSGPDPMWRDMLNTHQSQPFHVMIGGGDQIYNDSVSHKCGLFDEWLDIRNPQHKHIAAFTADMQDEMEDFYLERYCMWFSQGLFSLAASQIPMVNMYDDHDIFDGYGSYPHHYMKSPVFTGLGAVAFKYYMLFQHQSVLTETESIEPSWILGQQPGPYIKELSRSVYVSMGGKVALLAVDCRTERTEHDVVDDKTWEKIMNRLYAEVRRGQVEHLLVLLGVPIAYPRLVWLENILTSRLMDPVKALGRTGMFGKALNNIDGGVEVLDDLNDHWTAKNHKHERSIIIEDLQDFAIDKSLRITILSGDVHLAAVGQFYSNTKLGLAKHKDPRYMVNIISSAIVNTPPSNMLADVLNKRNKVHHFDKQTDESMVPLFHHGVDGKSRNNKHLLPHRNWCSIRTWNPGMTPPPTPPLSAYDRSPSPPTVTNNSTGTAGGSGLFRRLSLGGGRSSSNRFDGTRTSVRGSKPPVSGGMGGLFRSLSRRSSSDAPRPAKLARTMSLDSSERKKKGFFNFGRSGGNGRSDDGGINGQWGEDSEEDEYYVGNRHPQAIRPSGLRGGGTYEYNEYSDDDEAHFTARQPSHPAQTIGSQPPRDRENSEEDDPMMRHRAFHRTPTGLSAKQMRKADQYDVDLEGGLDICLNVEVNAKDPTGITVPYRLLVPRLHYEYNPADDELQQPSKEPQQPTGFKRFLSFRSKPQRTKPRRQDGVEQEETDDNDDYLSDASSDVVVPRR